jgi:hypothetical protein
LTWSARQDEIGRRSTKVSVNVSMKVDAPSAFFVSGRLARNGVRRAALYGATGNLEG